MTLPSQVELFDLGNDPGETTNLAEQIPLKVAQLQRRIEALSRDAAPPLVMVQGLPLLKAEMFGSVAFPGEVEDLRDQP